MTSCRPDLTVEEAWDRLGFNYQIILNIIRSKSRQDRLATIEKMAEVAKKTARSLLVQHHPDTGGDPDKFRKAQEALDAINYYTDEFRTLWKQKNDEYDETFNKCSVVIRTGK